MTEDSDIRSFNKAVVGNYYAICIIGGCGIVIPVPIIAEQRAARSVAESTIVTKPDLTGSEEHFKEYHPDYDPTQPLTDLPFKD